MLTTSTPVNREVALAVREACLCLATQRAARVLARRFDFAFAPLGITNNQFSLMMMLSGPEPAPMTRLAGALAMDRTTLTAALKALQRRGFVTVRADGKDKRVKRSSLTEDGRETLAAAVPIWKSEHAALEASLTTVDADQLRSQLSAITNSQQERSRP
ncbi:MAG: MarR family transcriptional regulator [Hyphomicrobium sp.]